MTSVYDVPAKPLIKNLAKKLQENDHIKTPDWASYVKTGPHRERPPVNSDWWYIRVAALLRKIYMNSPVGVTHLRSMYGGKADKGSKPNKALMGSGAIIRRSLQQLEKAGLIETEKGKGRVITSKGRSLLDHSAHEVLQELASENPELGKY
ncbi:MAG: 30S ribosomal protein S19e [Thermoplasmata archaeon]|nr:MAG: 30S ribosomal protein S19e [Thermoplasmata archaeon]